MRPDLKRVKDPSNDGSGAHTRADSTYRKTVLANGLRIVSEELTHVRSVSVGVWIDTGSRDESSLLNGISHFIEHMVFKGTRNRSVKEIARSIESVGGYMNAFTGKEHTCYYARVLDEHTSLAVDVLSDLVQNAKFPEKDLEKEKAVVIEELKNAEDDPDDIIHDYFDRALFGNHPLGNPVIGTEKNLRSFSRSDLVAYAGSHYVPRNMVLAAAGNVSHGQLVELAEEYFGSRSKHSRGGQSRRLKPRDYRPEKKEYKKPIQQAHVCLGTQAWGVKSKQRYPMLVLNTLLGDGMSSRLFQNIREKYGFAYSVYSTATLMSDAGVFSAYIGTDKQHVDFSTELILREFEKLVKKPVSLAELNRTKAQLKGSMMLSLESIPHRMMRLGTSELYFQDINSIDSILKQINGVRQEDVQDTAQSLFKQSRLSKVVIHPDGQRQTDPV
ncbi:MAG TPA: pitrilysin family protein [Bacteroidota bacterium]|nr:pitrilysin family protein [Bacteroidota bacterium]